MMNKPAIDELIKNVDNNRYKLCILISKRAKELEKRIPAELEHSEVKSISLAAQEVFERKIVASN